MSVIVGLSTLISVIVSAAVAICYVLIGQMVSVAYTDVAELILLTIGLVSESLLESCMTVYHCQVCILIPAHCYSWEFFMTTE